MIASFNVLMKTHFDAWGRSGNIIGNEWYHPEIFVVVMIASIIVLMGTQYDALEFWGDTDLSGKSYHHESWYHQ